MDIEIIYNLVVLSLEYINPKDKESALFAMLDLLYENDVCDIDSLRDYSESEENDWVAKKINTYLKQNGLDEEDEDEW